MGEGIFKKKEREREKEREKETGKEWGFDLLVIKISVIIIQDISNSGRLFLIFQIVFIDFYDSHKIKDS